MAACRCLGAVFRMTDSKVRKLVLTLATTGVATVLAFGINFFVTPLVTEKLGASAYGFITLANTFVGYAMIVMTALSSYATRFIAVEYHKGNQEKASCYFSTLIVTGLIQSALLFAVLALIAINIGSLMDVPENLLPDVIYLMLLVFVNFFVTMAGTFFSCAAYIKNKLDVYGIIQSISYVAEAVILIAMYSAMPPMAWYYGAAILVAGIVVALGNVWIYRRYVPEIEIKVSLFSFGDLKTLLVNGVWNSVNALGNTLNSGLDLVIANLFLNAVCMGQIAISKTFSGVFSRLFQLISQAFQPMFLESYSQRNKKKLLEELNLSMKLSSYISNVLFAGFFTLCPAFYRLWIPGQDLGVLYFLTMLTIVCSAAEGPVNPLYYVYTLTTKNRLPCFVTLVGGLINVVGMVFLLTYTDFGIYAVPLTTAVIMGVINLVFNPMYIAHCLGERLTSFYPSLLRIAASLGCMCALFGIVSSIVPNETWPSFALSALICAFMGVFIHFAVALNGSERTAALRRLKRKAGSSR